MKIHKLDDIIIETERDMIKVFFLMNPRYEAVAFRKDLSAEDVVSRLRDLADNIEISCCDMKPKATR